jgi:molecular chaperone HscA
MMIATQSALDADGELLEPADRHAIDALMAALHATATAAASDARTIEAATEALAQGTEAFAAERMNHGIRKALAGKKVESL